MFLKWNFRGSNVNLPASSFEKSKILLIILFISPQHRSINRSDRSVWASCSTSNSSLTLPRIPLTGVRNSCVTLATNSDFTFIASGIFVFPVHTDFLLLAWKQREVVIGIEYRQNLPPVLTTYNIQADHQSRC